MICNMCPSIEIGVYLYSYGLIDFNNAVELSKFSINQEKLEYTISEKETKKCRT